MKNPFETIAKINQSYKKYIITFLAIIFIALAPFAVRGFAHTNADFAVFLPKNLESEEAAEIINREFPSQADSSVVIVLKSKNSTMDVFDTKIVK
ncbi:MAG: hypothetical protein ACFFD4_35540, partial [Candidatus Odinarchaeota archaeon]